MILAYHYSDKKKNPAKMAGFSVKKRLFFKNEKLVADEIPSETNDTAHGGAN